MTAAEMQQWAEAMNTAGVLASKMDVVLAAATERQAVKDYATAQARITAAHGMVAKMGLALAAIEAIRKLQVVDAPPVVDLPPVILPPPTTAGGSAVLDWATQAFVNTTGFVIGQTFVAQFTTGAAPVTSGQITCTEYRDSPRARHARLCYDAAGTMPVTTTSTFGGPKPVEAWGNAPGIAFGAAVSRVAMKPNTTYFYLVTCETSPGVLSGPAGTPANMQLQLSHG